MKKAILSFVMIVGFIAYSWHARGEQAGAERSETMAPAAQPSASAPAAGPVQSTPVAASAQGYKDGIYTGNAADAFYGIIQVRVTVNNSAISDVVFLRYPNDRSTSIAISKHAMPLLKQEAIRAQNAQVDTVSGATDTSQAFVESLASALSQAKG